jgi:hypothetical protein
MGEWMNEDGLRAECKGSEMTFEKWKRAESKKPSRMYEEVKEEDSERKQGRQQGKKGKVSTRHLGNGGDDHRDPPVERACVCVAGKERRASRVISFSFNSFS